jgi:predicted small secreted protein
MKLHLIKSSFVLLSLNLVGCTTNTPAGGGAATAVGTGPAIAQTAMPEYCQGAAATQYGATSGNITTQAPVPRSFGSLVVGTADTGQKTYMFNCRFDSSGRFIGISET